MRYLSSFLGIVPIFLTWNCAVARDGTLFLIQPTPVNGNHYVVSKQIDAMKIGFELALNAFKKKYPSLQCKPDIKINFQLRTDAKLFDEVRLISQTPGKKALIGVTRTDFARLAARAAAGTDLIGISSAAISDELHDINPNFISIGTRYQNQWKVAAAGLRKLRCVPSNTLGVFALNDVWSEYYKKSYLRQGYDKTTDLDKFLVKPVIDSHVKCIVFGVPAPAAIKPLSQLFVMQWPGAVIGPQDWTYFSDEIRSLLADYEKRATRVYTNLIWTRNETDKSKAWAGKNFDKSEVVEPIHVTAFDATMIALNYLCRNQNVLKFDSVRWSQFGTVRDYQALTPSGNLEAPIYFVELPLEEWK